MNIINAKIDNVTVGLDQHKRLNVKMELEQAIRPPSIITCNFTLTDPSNAEFVAVLMEYAGEEVVTKLNGKIIRIITSSDHKPIAWGHPIEDKFLTWIVGGVLQQTCQQTIEEMLS